MKGLFIINPSSGRQNFKENLTLTQQKYYFEVKKEGADIEDSKSDIVAYGGDDGVVIR